MLVSFSLNNQIFKKMDLQLEELIALLGSEEIRFDEFVKVYKIESKMLGLGDNRRHLVVSLVEK